MSEFIRLQANGVDAYPDASTENTYRSNGTSVESALLALESNVNTLGGVAGEAKTLAEQNSVKIATAEQEISDINSSLSHFAPALKGNSRTLVDALTSGVEKEITIPFTGWYNVTAYNAGTESITSIDIKTDNSVLVSMMTPKINWFSLYSPPLYIEKGTKIKIKATFTSSGGIYVMT